MPSTEKKKAHDRARMQRKRAETAIRIEALETALSMAMQWHEGEPPKPWRDEWFIAETVHHDRFVLRSLPDEWTYDYTTADETYMMAKNIKRWMQFPDSHFKEFRGVPYELLDALKALLDRYHIMGCGDGPEALQAALVIAKVEKSE